MDLTKITTIELTQREEYLSPSNTLTVKVGGIDVMSWMQTDDSTLDAPEFTGFAQFAYEQWCVYTTANGWQDQFIDGVETKATVFPLGFIADATDAAIAKMFGDAARLEIVPDHDGEFSISLDGTEVLAFRDPLEFGALHCLAGDLPIVPETGLVFSFWSKTRYGWKQWDDGESGYDVDTFEARQIGNIAPHAYRALINGWIV